MTAYQLAVLDYIKEHYQDTYNVLSGNGTLTPGKIWSKIDRTIEYSKRHHCGLDMSGLTGFLSTVKLERIALGLVDIDSVKLYEEQWDRVFEMQKKGINRTFKLSPYAAKCLS